MRWRIILLRRIDILIWLITARSHTACNPLRETVATEPRFFIHWELRWKYWKGVSTLLQFCSDWDLPSKERTCSLCVSVEIEDGGILLPLLALIRLSERDTSANFLPNSNSNLDTATGSTLVFGSKLSLLPHRPISIFRGAELFRFEESWKLPGRTKLTFPWERPSLSSQGLLFPEELWSRSLQGYELLCSSSGREQPNKEWTPLILSESCGYLSIPTLSESCEDVYSCRWYHPPPYSSVILPRAISLEFHTTSPERSSLKSISIMAESIIKTVSSSLSHVNAETAAGTPIGWCNVRTPSSLPSPITCFITLFFILKPQSNNWQCIMFEVIA